MIVDLTRRITKNIPITSLHKVPYEIEWLKKLPNVMNLSKLTIYSHRGTHIDAPYHFLENGKKIDEINIDRFIGKGFLIDLSDKKRSVITSSDLPALKIPKGSIIIINTGLEKYWEQPILTKWTEISEEVAAQLIKFEPKMIGIDSQGIDTEKNDYRSHKIILSADVPIIEGLVNLDKLVGKEFDVFAFPLKISDIEAIPARVLAMVK